jgi:hypothetical protein
VRFFAPPWEGEDIFGMVNAAKDVVIADHNSQPPVIEKSGVLEQTAGDVEILRIGISCDITGDNNMVNIPAYNGIQQ